MMPKQESITQAIAQVVVQVMKASVQAMAVIGENNSGARIGPKLGGPTLKQPTFDWSAMDKYMNCKPWVRTK